MGAAAIGATIYFGSDDADREIEEVARGLRRGARARPGDDPLVLPAQPRVLEAHGVDHHTAADLTAQANHLGVTLGADVIKQKLPTHNGGYNALEKFGKTAQEGLRRARRRPPGRLRPLAGGELLHGQDRPDQLRRRLGAGASDLAEAVRTAVVNKRGGGMGLISGRKAFQRPPQEGIALLNAIQDVYLCNEVTVA